MTDNTPDAPIEPTPEPAPVPTPAEPFAESPDVLATSAGLSWFEAARIKTTNTHGTGCTLSAAIASQLVLGLGLEDAIVSARSYLQRALESGSRRRVGAGH